MTNTHPDNGVVPMDEGAVCPIPLPQDHVQLGVMCVRIEGAELVHVKGLRVDLEGSKQDLSQPRSISSIT